ncbi:hypothetical protein BN7874_245 [Phage NCTB]|nr:hypothetical protein BN7874_245 [Phage NCTB]
MRVVVTGGVTSIGLQKELESIMKRIDGIDVKRDPIIKVADVFFDSVKLYDKLLNKDVDLWIFIYSNTTKNRLMDAFTKRNRIDGETMQRELNSNKAFGKKYVFFNKVYQKNSDVPHSWLTPGTPQHTKLYKHFKQEKVNGLLS